MNSGLYVRAGACATARAAACAISLFGPTTKDSNVFRGLSPGTVAPGFVSAGGSGKIFSNAGGSAARHPPASSRRRAELHRAWAAERRDDGRLQRGHIITFYPKLIDVVWNAKSERLVFRFDELDRREPAFKAI